MAAVYYFLKIEGIPGESEDLKLKDYIVLESFNWGEANSGHATASAAGAGAGRVSFQDFHFTSKISKASPLLMQACASGKHLVNAILIGLRTANTEANAGQFQFLKYTLTDVLVSSVQEGGSAGDTLPVDQVSLNFIKIEVEYKEQKPDGSLGATTNFAWNLRANAKI